MCRENNKKMEQSDQKKSKSNSSLLKGLVKIIVVVVLIASFYYYLFPFFTGNEAGQITTITESTLVSVVKKARLNSVEYPYSGYTKVTKDDKDLYYVRYKGSVKAGIDMDKVNIELDKENKTVRILMPEIEIDDVHVDSESLDTIFIDEKANTEDVGGELYQEATKDMEKKINERQDEIKEMAEENTKRSLEALIEPWLNQVSNDGDYNIVVVAPGEE